MPNSSSEKEYFVSYCVVRGSLTNPAGHSYLVFSELDHSLKQDARVEVVDAIGFYGHPHEPNETIQKALFPAKLIGPGHIQREHLRYLVEGTEFFHHHRTWIITEEQKHQLIQGFETDRGFEFGARDFKAEKEYWDRLKTLEKDNDQTEIAKLEEQERLETKNAGGPYFNLFKHSCMTDARKRLNAVGVPTPRMHRFIIDIPGLSSGPLDKMLLKYESSINKEKGRVFWKSPLALTPNTTLSDLSLEEQARMNNARVFIILNEAVQQIELLFSKKIEQLQAKGKQAGPLSEAHTRLKALKYRLQETSPYPNRYSKALNHEIESEFGEILNDCQHNIEKQNTDPEIVHFFRWVVDVLTQYFSKVGSFFGYHGFDIYVSIHGIMNQAQNHYHDAQDELKPHRASIPV